MKFIAVIILSLLALNAGAQKIVCLQLPGGGYMASAQIGGPAFGLNEHLSLTTRDDKPYLDFNWIDTKNILGSLKDSDISKSTIIIKMDNDSLLIFKPNPNPSKISAVNQQNNALMLNIDADITALQASNLNNHKLISLTLVTAANTRYDLFIFTPQNQTDIQKMTGCFLDNIAGH